MPATTHSTRIRMGDRTFSPFAAPGAAAASEEGQLCEEMASNPAMMKGRGYGGGWGFASRVVTDFTRPLATARARALHGKIEG